VSVGDADVSVVVTAGAPTAVSATPLPVPIVGRAATVRTRHGTARVDVHARDERSRNGFTRDD